jgi:hypothetical protein
LTPNFLVTPLFIHAHQAIQALEAGKHVISEVIAAYTLEDGVMLIQAVEKTGLTYMMAENYCYMRANLMVKQLAHAGMFGELTQMLLLNVFDHLLLSRRLKEESIQQVTTLFARQKVNCSKKAIALITPDGSLLTNLQSEYMMTCCSLLI